MHRCESGRISPQMLEKFVRKHLVRGRETFGHTAVLSRYARGAADTHTHPDADADTMGRVRVRVRVRVRAKVRMLDTDADTTTGVRCMHAQAPPVETDFSRVAYPFAYCRQDMVGDVVRGVLKDLDGDGDGVVSLDDFLEWSRVHNLETLVDDYAAAAWEKARTIERLEAQATSGTPYD